MKESKILKANYSNIIQSTVHRPPNYEVIHFDKFIDILFPNRSPFISSEIIEKIRASLGEKFNRDHHYIKKHGILASIEIEELKFYQPEVGINGPMYTQINEPLYVINHDNKMILYNGYHRILFHILNNHLTIKAYILTTNFNQINACKHSLTKLRG